MTSTLDRILKQQFMLGMGCTTESYGPLDVHVHEGEVVSIDYPAYLDGYYVLREAYACCDLPIERLEAILEWKLAKDDRAGA